MMNVIRWLHGSDMESLLFRYVIVPIKFKKSEKYDRTSKALFYENCLDDFEYVCYSIEDITCWKEMSKIKRKTATGLRLYYLGKLLNYYEYLYKQESHDFAEYEVYKRLKEDNSVNYDNYFWFKGRK